MSNIASPVSGPDEPGHADLTPSDAPNDQEALRGARRPPLLSFVLEYWKSNDRWVAYALMAVIFAVMFGTTWLAVWNNKLQGEITDSLVNKKWHLALVAFATSIAVAVSSGVVHISSAAITGVLDLRWRAWLTDRLLERWTRASTFYDVERDGLLKNADQRIAEDVRIFCEQSLNIFTSFTGVVVSSVTFTVLLWNLSQVIELNLFGSNWQIAGYMVFFVYAYAIGSLLVTHYFGKKLIALTMQKQGVEADYRYLAMQLRENAEQVALYKGGAREHARLTERFAFVKTNFIAIVVRLWKVDLARNTYGLLFEPLPTIAALPLYVGGLATYGGMMRAADAFRSVRSSLSFFSQAYVGIASWLAIANRLRDLIAALDAAEAIGRGGFVIDRADQAGISTSEISLRTPNGAALAKLAPLEFRPGERWLVRGPSGTGKSTLLRAIAGIWPHGEGAVRLPRDASLLFLPQRSYLPSGSLAAAICYPAEPTEFTDEQLREALTVCGLPQLIPSLNSVDHWQQKLSGGEQQRLAFARVLLHRPAFVFLDEATSAVDPATEQRLYQALLASLPNTGVISIAHRESLAAYHGHVLDVEPAPGRVASAAA